MITLFYSIMLITLVVKVYVMLHKKDITDTIKLKTNEVEMMKKEGKSNNEIFYVIKGDLLKLGFFVMIMLIYIPCTFVGLLSSNWFYFIILISLHLFPEIKNTQLSYIRTISSILLLGFIIINKYYLHYYIY